MTFPTTTFVSKVTVIARSWLQAVNDWLWNEGYVDNYWSGTGDATVATQSAMTNLSKVKFRAGTTYNLTGDVSIPSNRKIHVEKGATVINTGGRFTADTQTNIEWQIDGWVKSVAMATAASKPNWTGSVGERGFIEFGFNYAAGTAGTGFWVHGTGIVSGDWTGTPNFSAPVDQINRKGICCWNAKNVLVEGLEVYGFDGEAIYASFFDAASKNIVFRNNYVHDTRFNSLNFNAGTNGGGCSINHNSAINTYQLECSVGDISDNYIDGTLLEGIYTGSGAGYGPITIKGNTVKNAGSLGASPAIGIAAIFAAGTPVTNVVIENNTIINSNGYSIYTDYCRELIIRGNTCVGTGQATGSYDIGVSHGLRGSVSQNTFMSPGGFAQSGRVATDVNTFDVAVDPVTNVYVATTGTVTPVGNQFGVIDSGATIAIPVLGSYFWVTGVAGINTITATGCNGREITLVFQSTPTLTDGSNLKLAGNFVASADDTIKLICDGTNWYEVCRSVN